MRVPGPLLRAALVLLLAGCGAAPGPSGPAASASAARRDPSDRPDPGAVVVDQLGGAWRFSPVIVDDPHIAIVSDACAAKARETLGTDAGDLPTALVDARGEHFVTVIMADDLSAIECLARLSDDGASATVDAVDRLSATAVAPVEKSAITVASVIQQDDRSDGRVRASLPGRRRREGGVRRQLDGARLEGRGLVGDVVAGFRAREQFRR